MLNNNLKIALVQSAVVWEDSLQNRLDFSEKIGLINEDVDLIVLPEMFTTGFSMTPSTVAETMGGEAVQWMQQKSAEKNAAITGSLIIAEDGNYYNRLLFVFPSGEIKQYNKRHLFSLAGEEKIYKSGNNRLVVDYKGWKICPLICYDLRFPVWARNTVEYDLLLYVANWPKPRIKAWDALLKARAIENLSYTLGLNRVGTDANKFEYPGHSVVYDCLGAEVNSCKTGKEETLIVTLEKVPLFKTRKALNFLSDRDQFTL